EKCLALDEDFVKDYLRTDIWDETRIILRICSNIIFRRLLEDPKMSRIWNELKDEINAVLKKWGIEPSTAKWEFEDNHFNIGEHAVVNILFAPNEEKELEVYLIVKKLNGQKQKEEGVIY
ncbi:MAG: hypothetical protein QXV85_10650, partial [Candidatus Bathyarchaeia archaeon]